ncbi:MAG: FumA C-terminus/TtdB family hydratase beta subunit [Deltaproteobacteria bacterium]|nr:FumA C-terminus/TtdB family hydratase beta subunit [Deltaproteobacteria bacterium]
MSKDATSYRLISKDGIEKIELAGKAFLKIKPEVIVEITREAFKDMAFYLRDSHLHKWLKILQDTEADDNEKFVVGNLLKNAIIASSEELPLCQDTGTATIMARKGERVLSDSDDKLLFEKGIMEAYRDYNLRYSQVAATSMLVEKNTGNNLPAQIEINSVPGEEYDFLFMAKGGGSTNKTFLSMESKSLLTDENLEKFLRAQIGKIGVAACPPYYLGIVVGGTSPEANLKILKLATAGALDNLPTRGDGSGKPFRDLKWEKKAAQIAQETGLGAQFGGKYLAMDVKVVRLSRHAGSCPVSLGVSCSAHRNLKGRITADGVFLEELVKDSVKFMNKLAKLPELAAKRINLDQPLDKVREKLSKLTAGSLVLLNGSLIVARDIAHARIAVELRKNGHVSSWFKNYPVYYAGPAKTPEGQPIGSFGPTTAQRMDVYLPELMAAGGSLITLAKGNRSSKVTAACKQHGGFYLGTIGGAAALLARENIKSSEIIAFPELGMEAVRKIEVEDLPAFIVVDDKGNSLY